MKLLAIIEETFREARARKTLIGFFIFSTLMILAALLVFNMDIVQQNLTKHAFQGKVHAPKNIDASTLLTATILDYVWVVIAALLFFITICVGIFSTAGLITSIMEKGTIDLMLSKPVPRWLYIIGRYLGAVLIMTLEVVYFVLGLWVVVGITTGSWSGLILVSIPYIVLGFAGLYSVVVLIGVLTRSSWLAIILGFVIYFISGLLLPLGTWLDKLINGEGTTGVFGTVATIVHSIIPQLNDLSSNMGKVILAGSVEWTPILMTTLMIVVYLALSSLSFSRKEF